MRQLTHKKNAPHTLTVPQIKKGDEETGKRKEEIK
jgi:hypothetical protein